MPLWLNIVIMVASAVLSYALRPRQQGPQPTAFEDIDFPQATEGTPQAVVFGDVWTADWMVLGVGDYRVTDIRRLTSSGRMRASSVLACSQTITPGFTISPAGR